MSTALGQIGVEQSNTITSNYTSAAGINVMSPGPITINTGVTVNIVTGSRWSVV